MVARTAKQVVILGGTGFIGRRLVETLGLQGRGVRVPIRVRAYVAGAGSICVDRVSLYVKSWSSSWPTYWVAKG